MKSDEALGTAIGFTSTMSIIFMICYYFNMTKTPFFLLLVGIMSFGYTLFLLHYYQPKKSIAYYLYLFFGIVLILLPLILSFTTPHENSLFF